MALMRTATIAAFSSCIFGAAAAQNVEDWRTEATRLFLEDNTTSVVEAMFTADRSFWISMRDNGSRRDGFAEYACIALHDFGMPYGETVIISVWDAYAMAQGDLVKIGENHCELRQPG
ncbi:hypothetical protein [Tropicimonas sp. IMCC34011]|uniref:hypothetical protein n=1 Tax=Tropicimonas sp. IMCC34011 TaxID=2248759 RepID=UPI000E2891A9|nr:hypothetical protein [Tropicimonas sp. IMCC34011]